VITVVKGPELVPIVSGPTMTMGPSRKYSHALRGEVAEQLRISDV
jgi:hypothetical protein